MISLVAVVLAVAGVGCNAGLIPFSGILPHAYSGAHLTYSVAPSVSVKPLTYRVAVPTQYVSTGPAVVAAAPTQYLATAAIPAVPTQTQFHSQDELGAYHFGHVGGPSSRNEVRDHFGNVRGSYNYIDSEGQVQTTHYTAGREGFKVAASNLPVAPIAPVAVPAEAPLPVGDTAEVQAAKTAFRSAFDKAVADNEAAVAAAPVEPAAAEPAATPVRRKRSAPVVAVHASPYAYNPYSWGSYGNSFGYHPTVYSAGFPSNTLGPLAYTAGLPATTTYAAGWPAATTYTAGWPAATTYTAGLTAPTTGVRDAELLKITNTPGHATSYRVL